MEVAPTFGPRQDRWPDLQIAGDRSKRRICEQVEAAFETFVGDALSDRGNQPVASRPVVGLPQDDMFCRDGTIRSTTHVGGSGPVDIAEERADGGTEDSDTDQRQPQRGRS